jgi:hypothetical protein
VISSRIDRRHGALASAVLCAFDLLELDRRDLRREPIEKRMALLAKLLKGSHLSIVLNEHYEEDGEIVFREACRLGCEGIVSNATVGAFPIWRWPRFVEQFGGVVRNDPLYTRAATTIGRSPMSGEFAVIKFRRFLLIIHCYPPKLIGDLRASGEPRAAVSRRALQLFDNKPAALATADQRAFSLAMKAAN